MSQINFFSVPARLLSPAQKKRIKRLSVKAFGEVPWQYKFMSEAIHVIGVVDHKIVTHALWTTRYFSFDQGSTQPSKGKRLNNPFPFFIPIV